MKRALLTFAAAVVGGSVGIGQIGSGHERVNNNADDKDLPRIEWDEPRIVFDPSSWGERPNRLLALSGRIFYDTPLESPGPTWSTQGLQILIARNAGEQPNWAQRVSLDDTVWWPTTSPRALSAPAWYLGDFGDELRVVNIDDDGRFLALIPPVVIDRPVGKAGHFQVGAILGERPDDSLYSHLRDGIVLERSTRMLPIQGSAPLPPMQVIINGAPSPSPRWFEPVGLVRAVNRLHALGFDRAVRELRDYFAIAQGTFWGPRSLRIYGRPESCDATDPYRFFLILRLLFEPVDGSSAPYPFMRSGLMRADPSGPFPGERYPLILVQDLPFFAPEWLGGRSGPDPSPEDHLQWAIEHCKLRDSPLRPPDDPLRALEELESIHSEHITGNDPRVQLWRALEEVTGLPVPKMPLARFEFGPGVIRHRLSVTDWNHLKDVVAELDIYWHEQSQSYRSKRAK